MGGAKVVLVYRKKADSSEPSDKKPVARVTSPQALADAIRQSPDTLIFLQQIGRGKKVKYEDLGSLEAALRFLGAEPGDWGTWWFGGEQIAF